MRKLLHGQHDLLRQLSAQFDGAAQRREHLRALMKTLWLQLAALRAETAADAAASSDVTGRIRANCNEIAIQAEGGRHGAEAGVGGGAGIVNLR